MINLLVTADFDTYRTYGRRSIMTYTENGEILRQRTFLRKSIEIIKTLNRTALNQCN